MLISSFQSVEFDTHVLSGAWCNIASEGALLNGKDLDFAAPVHTDAFLQYDWISSASIWSVNQHHESEHK